MKKLSIPLTVIILLTVNISSVYAVLGNNINQNMTVLGNNKSIPKYNFRGSKDVIIYKKNNLLITVIYKDKISILENISYDYPVSEENAQKDINDLILPSKTEKPKYKSNVVFSDGHYEENIYKNGIKIKIIYNKENKATEIISSKIQYITTISNNE